MNYTNKEKNKVKKLNIKVDNCERKKEYEGMLKYCNQILKIDPQNYEAIMKKAKALANLEKDEESFNFLDKMIEANPQYPEIHSLKGSILFSKGRAEEAINEYNQYLKENPDNLTTLGNKYLTHRYLNNKKEANETLNQLLNSKEAKKLYNEINDGLEDTDTYATILSKDKLGNLSLLTQTLIFQEDYDRVIIFSDIALNIEPTNKEFLYTKAYAHLALEEYEDCEQTNDKLLELEPWNVDALNIKATLYLKENELLNAEETLNLILSLDPDNQAAQEQIKIFKQTHMYGQIIILTIIIIIFAIYAMMS